MINRVHRFHGHNSLRFVYQKGSVVRGPLFSIKTAINNRRDKYRLAVVVSKKISKSAVIRNRIRRRLYELVRLHQADITKPIDMVITVFSDQVGSIDSKELEAQISSQLAQVNRSTSNSTPVRDKILKKEIK